MALITDPQTNGQVAFLDVHDPALRGTSSHVRAAQAGNWYAAARSVSSSCATGKLMPCWLTVGCCTARPDGWRCRE